jgi:chloramphenicol-sensitive protein RarD
VGLLQYIGPTLSLGLGVFVFHEPFGAARAFGFVFIWTGCLIYALDSFRAR